ncbi:MAG: leucine-rich repeat domain-containing protein, partial [Clostridiales Family XIII bacterium]|nr:leucine-rich repeat domain-containing protein [Clostridiales Family XIII bacterium]
MLLSFSSASGADYAADGADSALSVTGANEQPAPLSDANDLTADSATGAESDEEPDEDAATDPSAQNVSDEADTINAEQSDAAGEPVAVKKASLKIGLMSVLEPPTDGYTNLASGSYLQVNANGVVEAVNLGDLKKIFIPAQAKDTSGNDVDITAIGANVFAGKGLEGVEFSPDSKITTIGAGAFSGNVNMIIAGKFLPATLKTIGNQAFMNTGITQIDLPSSLTSIGTEAFRESKLTSIDIPGSIKNLSNSIFYNCTSLTSATLNEGLETNGGNCFYNCYLQLSNNGRGEIRIPSTVKSMGGGIFNGNRGLTINAPFHTPSQLNLGGSSSSSHKFLYFKDTHPDSYWFIDDTTGLLGGIKRKGAVPTAAYPIDDFGNLVIPKQVGSTIVKEIGDTIFTQYISTSTDVIAIKTVAFEAGSQVEAIGTHSFSSSNSMTTVTFPDTLKTIKNAFYGCTSLGPLTFPASFETLGNGGFQYDTKLTSITFLGSAVKSIGVTAFDYTGMAIQDIYFPQMEKDSVTGAPWAAQFATIHWKNNEITSPQAMHDDVTGFYYTADGAITAYDGPAGSNVDLLIPGEINGTLIKNLGYAAMKGIAGGFRHVTIGEGIIFMDREFMMNTPIKTLTLPASKVELSRDVFNGCGIESLNFSPNSTLTNIGTLSAGSVFANNKLTTLSLPDSITSI